MGTVHVLEAARRASGVRAVVVVTSDKCYENREWWWPYREDEALGGHDPYSSSKAGAELVTAAWRRSFGGRPSGSRRRAPATSSAAATGPRIASSPTACGASPPASRWSSADPTRVRPWQHVLEPLAGYLAARRAAGRRARGVRRGLELRARRRRRPAGRRGGRPAGRSSGVAVPSGSTDDAEHPHEAGLLQVDASKARARLGWRPRLSLDEASRGPSSGIARFGAGEDAAAISIEQIERYGALEKESRRERASASTSCRSCGSRDLRAGAGARRHRRSPTPSSIRPPPTGPIRCTRWRSCSAPTCALVQLGYALPGRRASSTRTTRTSRRSPTCSAGTPPTTSPRLIADRGLGAVVVRRRGGEQRRLPAAQLRRRRRPGPRDRPGARAGRRRRGDRRADDRRLLRRRAGTGDRGRARPRRRDHRQQRDGPRAGPQRLRRRLRRCCSPTTGSSRSRTRTCAT